MRARRRENTEVSLWEGGSSFHISAAALDTPALTKACEPRSRTHSIHCVVLVGLGGAGQGLLTTLGARSSSATNCSRKEAKWPIK